MLWLLALVVALVLLVPGIEFLRWLVVDVMRLYDKFTLADGCLVLLVFLQLVLLFHVAAFLRAWRREEQEDPFASGFQTTAQPSLNGEPGGDTSRPRSPRQTSRRPRSSSGNRTSRSSSRRRPRA
ncbi:MAG: hypothetical protein J7M26_10490 [Armatimonadetes bacterium]|nr:hypothetical protein [Armatimonadota bacterium]